MKQTSDYRRAYEAAKQELTDLLSQQEQVGKRLVVVRQSIQTLATLCESEGIDVDPSDEADALIQDSSLSDEIRIILSAHFGMFFMVSGVKDELQRLGHDLSQYKNPQSTIQMVLKRMVQSGDVEEKKTDEGKYAYAMVTPRWMETARQAIARNKPETALNRFKQAHDVRAKRKTLGRSMADGLASIVAPRNNK